MHPEAQLPQSAALCYTARVDRGAQERFTDYFSADQRRFAGRSVGEQSGRHYRVACGWFL